MIEIKSYCFDNKTYADLGSKIRKKVFVKEQNVEPDIEFDNNENLSFHYLIYYKNKAVGTARWRQTCEGIKLERFAILKEYRGLGLSAELIKRILDDTKDKGVQIYLNAQEQVVALYEKYGFQKVGERFTEANIPHFKMIYKG